MPDSVVATILGGLAGVLAGALAAIATVQAKGIEASVEALKARVTIYDSRFLDQRLTSYKKLWSLTEPTSHRKVSNLNEPAALADALTDWYYQDGGMLMTAGTRDAFFAARATLEEPRSDTWEGDVVGKFSALRTALCDDLTSREGASLRGTQPG